MNLSNRIKRWMQRITNAPSADQNSKLLQNLMQMLQMTHTEELSCDEVFVLLDQYAEKASRGENVAELMPLIQHHLELCPDCHEEYDALMRVLKASPS